MPSPKEEEVAHLEEVGEAEEMDHSFEDMDDLEAAVELVEDLATAIYSVVTCRVRNLKMNIPEATLFEVFGQHLIHATETWPATLGGLLAAHSHFS